MKMFNFITKRYIAFIIAGVLLLAGIISFIAVGFNFGVDFSGGSKITLKLQQKATENTLDDIESIVKNEVGENHFVSCIRSTSNNCTVIVTIKAVTSFDNSVREALAELYKINADDIGEKVTNTDSNDNEYATFTFNSSETVDQKELAEKLNALSNKDVFKSVSAKDGTVTLNFFSTSIEEKIVSRINEKYAVDDYDSNTISKNRAAAQTKTALIASGVAIVLMFVYIAFRFKHVSSALASVVCLFFNLFIMFMFYSVFRWELTLDIIPACLTILGYSINATIVIFDRIRENYSKDKTDFNKSANDSVHSTLGRSINTTITTLITIILVYILGVESIKAFAFPLIIGIIAGLFSSVFLSAPLWSIFRKEKVTKSK